MTYKELIQELNKLTEKQLELPVTVELSYEEECLPGELRITGSNHNFMEDGYPVIFVSKFTYFP